MPTKNGYKGKIMVRVPPYLHEKLAKAAEDQGVSMNALIASCLAEAVSKLAADRRIKRIQSKAENGL